MNHLEQENARLREEFEKIVLNEWNGSVAKARNFPDDYLNGEIQNRWFGFKAGRARSNSTKAAKPVAPDGWQLVPMVPTEEMINALYSHIWPDCGGVQHGGSEGWDAALATSPECDAPQPIADALGLLDALHKIAAFGKEGHQESPEAALRWHACRALDCFAIARDAIVAHHSNTGMQI